MNTRMVVSPQCGMEGGSSWPPDVGEAEFSPIQKGLVQVLEERGTGSSGAQPLNENVLDRRWLQGGGGQPCSDPHTLPSSSTLCRRVTQETGKTDLGADPVQQILGQMCRKTQELKQEKVKLFKAFPSWKS